VTVLTIHDLDVQGHSARAGKGRKEFPDEREVERLDPARPELRIVDQAGAAGDVEVHRGEALVHGDRGGAVAVDPLLGAKRLREGLAQADPDVLHQVVIVDVRVAAARDRQVEESVPGRQGQHVVQEGDRRVDPPRARPVEIQEDPDVRLRRLPLDPGLPCHLFSPRMQRADDLRFNPICARCS